MNSESFKAYIVVENRDQNSVTELGRGELVRNQDQSSFVEAKVDVKYLNTSLKSNAYVHCLYIKHSFSSCIRCPSKGSVGEIPRENADSRFVGNVLTS